MLEIISMQTDLKDLRRKSLEAFCEEAGKSRDGMFNYILSMPEWLTGYTSFCTMPALYCEKTYEAIKDAEDARTRRDDAAARSAIDKRNQIKKDLADIASYLTPRQKQLFTARVDLHKQVNWSDVVGDVSV